MFYSASNQSSHQDSEKSILSVWLSIKVRSHQDSQKSTLSAWPTTKKQPPGRTHRVNNVKVGILNDGAKDLVEGRADEENEERKGHPQPAEENEEYGPSETSSTTALNGETRLVYFDVHSTVSALLFD